MAVDAQGDAASAPPEVFAQADLQLAGQLGGFLELHFQVNLNMGRWFMLSRARSRVDFIINNNARRRHGLLACSTFGMYQLRPGLQCVAY